MKYQEKYFNRAKKVAFWLQFIPYLRAVFLTGSVARGEATKKSDIDFFIVTYAGRIWTCRALVTIFIQCLGIRRYGDKIAGRICLNRYQTEDNLEIRPHNAYHKKDYSQIIPLVDNNIYNKYKMANKWIKQFKNQKSKVEMTNQKYQIIQKISETILNNSFGNLIEKKLKKYQKHRILNDPRTKSSA
jgi:predicted nucleotidyltransferase